MTATNPVLTNSASRVAETRAAVWRGGNNIALERVPVPALRAGEILVEVHLATVCGSDRHTVSGRRRSPCPSILGHETVGRVIALGDGSARSIEGTGVNLGDRVVWTVTFPCGTCDRCLAGFTAKCRTVRKAGHESLDSDWPLSGGYAQHILLPKGMPVAVVEDDLPDALAAPAACATATVMAVTSRAGSLAGKRVVVIGSGMLGLTAIAVAAASGAKAVTAVDVALDRLEIARAFGATELRTDLPGPNSCDVVFEFSGSPHALEKGIAALDTQGIAVLAGTVAPGDPVAIDPESVVRRQLSIFGSHNYEPRHLTAALAFLGETQNRFPWSELVSAPRPFVDITDLLTGQPGPTPRYAIDPR